MTDTQVLQQDAPMVDKIDDKPLTDILFSSFELHPAMLAGLESAGFTRCTPIQALTLPISLTGRDVAGQAQTGTGKTLAFLITLVQRLMTRPALANRGPADPRAMILAPTRELAIQIHKDAEKFCAGLGLKFALIYGGVDYDKQRSQLTAGCDVIIATPGRLIDYVRQGIVHLHACEVCILDEADRMFDLGFIKDLRFLLRKLPRREERQTLMFSATLSHRVLELAYEHTNEPEKVIVETETITASRVRQVVYFPSNDEKLPLLISLLSRTDANRTMVFVNTKAWVERVGRALEKAGYRVGVLSGDVPQKKRQSLLAKFQRAELEILVATDVAARGLHIDAVSHVYNFDLPFDAEDYVHRIGRTARLGLEGDAISFACEIYAQSLPEIEAYIEQKIPVEAVTLQLLQPVPRIVRAHVANADGEVNESIADIFREARAEALATGRGPKTGSGRRSGAGDSSRSGPRSGSSSGSGSGAPRRADGAARPPRREHADAHAPSRDVNAPRPPREANTNPRPPRDPNAPPRPPRDANSPPREHADGERSRRSRARRPEGTAPAVNIAAKQANAAPPPSQTVSKESFLKRFARQVKSLVGPAPKP